MWILIFAVIGIITVIVKFLKISYKLLLLIRSINISYFNTYDSENLIEKYGSWALITGSTDGIGKEYALELARRGLNIILVSRNIQKLKLTAEEIESKYSVQTKIIVVDFSNARTAIEIVKQNLLVFPPVGILVNNVGRMYEYPMPFGELKEEDIWNLININVQATTLMTKLVISKMQKRGKGAIVNISAAGTDQPVPFVTVYFACKVYIDYFTEALREEYRDSGITIQLLSPHTVSTKMSNFITTFKNSFTVAKPYDYAKSAVKTLGKIDNTAGYWLHDILTFLISFVPYTIRAKTTKIFIMFLAKRYLKQR